MNNEDEEVSLFLWNAFDHLGFDYEQVKSLAVALLLKTAKEKTEKEMFDFLYNIKMNYNDDKLN